MVPVTATRAGTILAVKDVERSVGFYTAMLGAGELARYDDPPYATLTLAGARLSLAEQGHDAEDRPGVQLLAPDQPSRASVVLVIEVDDAQAAFEHLLAGGVEMLAPPCGPPWGGLRFFCRDPDGFLVEIEELA